MVLPALRPVLPTPASAPGGDAGFALLSSRLRAGRYVTFHPELAGAFGGFKAALFLGHALYWTRYVGSHTGGWFFMSSARCAEATGLSAHEQAAVRRKLKERGLIDQKLAGRPATLHYRINPAEVMRRARVAPPNAVSGEGALWTLPSVAYYKQLADVAGSVAAGLYLSFVLQAQHTLLQRQAGHATRLDPTYSRVSQEDIRHGIGLTPKTQRMARLQLKKAGLIEERSASLVRLNAAFIASRIGNADTLATAAPKALVLRPSSAQDTRAPLTTVGSARIVMPHPGHANIVSGALLQRDLFSPVTIARPEQASKALSRICVFGATGKPIQPLAGAHANPKVALFAKLDKKYPVKVSPFLTTSLVKRAEKLPFSQNYIKATKDIKELRQRARQDASSFGSDESGSRRSSSLREEGQTAQQPVTTGSAQQAELASLILPKALDPSWHKAVLSTLAHAPSEARQSLLDELAGQLSIAGKTIHNPAGWLYVLMRRQAEGPVALAMAEKVAADRIAREKTEAAVQAALRRSAQTRAQPVETFPASLSDAAQVAREKLREMRNSMGYRKTEE